jgi:hypothetical protein
VTWHRKSKAAARRSRPLPPPDQSQHAAGGPCHPAHLSAGWQPRELLLQEIQFLQAQVDETDALYMLGSCAAFVSYLINKARQAGVLGGAVQAKSAMQ